MNLGEKQRRRDGGREKERGGAEEWKLRFPV